MKIALTGGIAEGKSTVLQYLQDMGILVETSDGIARDLFSEPYIQRELAVVVGVRQVVPSELRTAIASSSEIRRKVNKVMHPAIRLRIKQSIATVIEVPLLIEAALAGEFDRTWVVTCGPEEQRRRLVDRLGNAAVADGLIRAQLPTEVKLAFADMVIRTNTDELSVKRCVNAAVQRTLGFNAS
jgi:dephospho-CoA kinase